MISIMNMDLNNISEIKRQIKYIFHAYKYTRPNQSNIFKNILRSYRADMLADNGKIDMQMKNIEESLREIYSRYNFKILDVYLNYVEEGRKIKLDISFDINNKEYKLSDVLFIDEVNLNYRGEILDGKIN